MSIDNCKPILHKEHDSEKYIYVYIQTIDVKMFFMFFGSFDVFMHVFF